MCVCRYVSVCVCVCVCVAGLEQGVDAYIILSANIPDVLRMVHRMFVLTGCDSLSH